MRPPARGPHYEEETPRLIRELIATGRYTAESLGRTVLGRDPSYVRQVARGAKPGTTLTEAVRSTVGGTPAAAPPVTRTVRQTPAARAVAGGISQSEGTLAEALKVLQQNQGMRVGGSVTGAFQAQGKSPPSRDRRWRRGEAGLWGTRTGDDRSHMMRVDTILAHVQAHGGGVKGLERYLIQSLVNPSRGISGARNLRRLTLNFRPPS